MSAVAEPVAADLAAGFRTASSRKRSLRSRPKTASEPALAEATKPEPLGHRDQHAGAGIAENAGLTAGIVLDLRALHRRIDRHRHRAGIENAEECHEEIDSRRQHERDPIARHDVALDQAGGDRSRAALANSP